MLTILVLLSLSDHCIHIQRVPLCDYSTYVLSSGEVARYKAKALMTDNTLLKGLLSRYYVASRFAHSSSICSYQSARSRLYRPTISSNK